MCRVLPVLPVMIRQMVFVGSDASTVDQLKIMSRLDTFKLNVSCHGLNTSNQVYFVKNRRSCKQILHFFERFRCESWYFFDVIYLGAYVVLLERIIIQAPAKTRMRQIGRHFVL